ncbi:phage tail protein [Brevundimonas sp.]|uniref:phage tail protein n=1 Tax=Brevundimonas sp. TaxID=1871086 RepID=UPI002ABAF68D|nr:tail fiber protein [Brevundimonas sp.]MDZ4363858.1 tail fiber protein [Brevundimonas sp.]
MSDKWIDIDCYLGEIRLFAGPVPPKGWLFCRGQELQVREYQALFSLLGTTWGGDGRNTFILPDMRGRVPMGQGQGQGLSPRILAQKPGAETVILTPETLGSHHHSLRATIRPATSVSPHPELMHAAVKTPARAYFAPTPPVTDLILDKKTLDPMGGGQAHDNMMPTTVINFMIAIDGLYPREED